MRTFEESCAYLDEIVGRCIRDACFAAAVLEYPEGALADYGLSEDEMDDFRALSRGHREDARQGWAHLRARLYGRDARGTSDTGPARAGARSG